MKVSEGNLRMNDGAILALKINAKKYIESYKALYTLRKYEVIDDDFYQETIGDLLDGIIDILETFLCVD